MKERMTQKDREKIQAEIDHRKLVLRPQILDSLKEARAQGDLSENFEYYAAKRENGANNSRIRYLERLLKNSEIVEDNTHPMKSASIRPLPSISKRMMNARPIRSSPASVVIP